MMSRKNYLLALFLTMLASLPVEKTWAQTYYSANYIPGCSDVGANMAAGGIAGAALGSFVGLITGNRGGALVADTVIGATAGIVAGASLSCPQRVEYVNTLNYQINQPNYWVPYTTRTSRIVLLQEGLSANGSLCRTYNSQYLTPGGWMSEETTSCRDNYGHWVMGFNPMVISDVRWHRWHPVPWFQEHVTFLPPIYYGQFYHPVPVINGAPVLDIYVHAGYLARVGGHPDVAAWHAQNLNHDGSLHFERPAPRHVPPHDSPDFAGHAMHQKESTPESGRHFESKNAPQNDEREHHHGSAVTQ